MEGLHFGEELINLCQCRLMLFIKGLETIDLSHVPLVVLGKGLKSLVKCGECGGRTHECREEPCQESPRHVVFPPGVEWSVEVNDDWEVTRGVPLGVPGHSSLVHAFNPPGQALVPVAAGEFNSHLSPVLNVSV
jgi:hypothetical protein